MHLLVALIVLAALASAEHADPAPVGGGAYRLILALVGMSGVVLFAAATARAVEPGLWLDDDSRRRKLQLFRRLRVVHLGLWGAAALCILFALQWTRLVQHDWGLGGTFLLDELLILVPVLLTLLLSWSVFYDVDRAAALTGNSSDDVASALGRGGYVLLQARHQFGLLLVPILILLAVQDGVALTLPGSLDGEGAWRVFAVPLAIFFLFFPLLLRFVWQTRPLPAGALRTRLEEAARRWGFRYREILVWETHGTVVNAAVTGFLPRLRYVFLTDGLLRHLEEEEIEAVFGHEIGHIRHHHLLLRGMAVVAPVCAWFAVRQVLPGDADAILARWAWTWGLSSGEATSLLSLLGMGLCVWLLFGFYSRRLESQADLLGCRVATSAEDASKDDAEPLTEAGVRRFVSALEKLSLLNGADRRLHRGGRRRAGLPGASRVVAIVTTATSRNAFQDSAPFLLSALYCGPVPSRFLQHSGGGALLVADRKAQQPIAAPPGRPCFRGNRNIMLHVDTVLDDRVLSALERNPHLPRRNLRFETKEGRVILRGVVGSYYQKQMAQEILRGVEGVQAIENQLEVNWS